MELHIKQGPLPVAGTTLAKSYQQGVHMVTHMSRRALLASAALPLLARSAAAADLTGPLTPKQRQRLIFERRSSAAQAALARELPRSMTNGDEDRYPDLRASFCKTMPHNELGEVDPTAYHKWLAILASGDSAQFEDVPRDPRATERLNDPQAAYAIDLVGADATALALPPPPTFACRATAQEMAQLYWRALMRVVPFRSFQSEPLARAALADLTAIGAPWDTLDALFRGETPPVLRGPHVSQFLWLDIPYGVQKIEQRICAPVRGQAFMTAFEDWLACQRGVAPRATLRLDGSSSFISTLRGLTEYVHRDFSFQAFMNAALIILLMGGARGDAMLSPTNPYRGSNTQFGDITLGNKNLLTLLAQASLLAQKTSYYFKWQVHRRARPEVFAARIDVQLSGRKTYDVHPAVLDCDGAARIKAAYGSWLLPQAYPEGSPTHPSYPAAHAVNAGACATVLKAFFDEHAVFAKPVQATADGTKLEPWTGEELTIGGEIDKLAANIALGRDAAGVHFRSDTMEGLKLGEAVGLALLAETSCTYSERFGGFVLSRFDGSRVRIADGAVVDLQM
jgi:hypothetical protein